MEKAKRKSGIELLRILCMLSIIILHVYVYGGMNDLTIQDTKTTHYILKFIWSFFRTPVNVFIIITGYFMSKDSLDFKKSYRRIPKVYLTMLFYSIVLTILSFVIFSQQDFPVFDSSYKIHQLVTNAEKDLTINSIYTIITMFFPFLSNQWYFLTNYIIILLLSSFINHTLNSINKKQFRILLGILFFTLSLWPTLTYMGGLKEIFSMSQIISIEFGKSLPSFLFMYIIGAYLRRFAKDDEKPHLKYLITFIVLCLIDFLLYFSLNKVNIKGTGIYGGAVFGEFSNPLVIMESLCLFMFFRGFQFHSKVINYIAGTTIGIYAIHEHPIFRVFIWSNLRFTPALIKEEPWQILNLLLTIIMIFAACAVIDIIRQFIFNKSEVAIKKLREKSSHKKDEINNK